LLLLRWRQRFRRCLNFVEFAHTAKLPRKQSSDKKSIIISGANSSCDSSCKLACHNGRGGWQSTL
jgi:hypothetical protein